MIAPRYHLHFLNSGYSDLLSGEILEHLQHRLNPEESMIMDLGCGSGWDTLWLVESGYKKVIAVDPHPSLLEQLFYKLKKQGIRDKVFSLPVNLNQPIPYHRMRVDLKVHRPNWPNYVDVAYAGMGVLQTVNHLSSLGQWLHKAVNANGMVAVVLLNAHSYSVFARQIKSKRQIGPWNRRRGEAGLNSAHSRSVKWMGSAYDVANAWHPWFELLEVNPLGEGLPPFETLSTQSRITRRHTPSKVQRLLNARNPARFADWVIALYKRRSGHRG